MADGLNQLDYVLMWYAFEGDALESYLFWTARGREPPDTFADDNRSRLPPEFVELATEWLRLRPGRRFVMKAGDFAVKAESVAELIAGFDQLYEERRCGTI